MGHYRGSVGRWLYVFSGKTSLSKPRVYSVVTVNSYEQQKECISSEHRNDNAQELRGNLYFFLFFKFTILYWFCHISTWIHNRYTRVTHPEASSLLPPCTIPLGHPSAPAPSIQYRAWNLDWQLVSYMILYMFQCHSPKSSHPLLLPQSPKDCSIHQCLFCRLIHRVIVTIFLNSIYMR